jgi:hypothetical protein
MIGGLSTRAERRAPVVVQRERHVVAPVPRETRVVVPDADRDDDREVGARPATRS